jgi:hypothetical protein
MLSKDEIDDGMTFILQLWDDTGAPAQWIEKLQGVTAMRWYDIYRRSDWNAVRSEASQRRQRCKRLERGTAHRICSVTIYGEG